MQTLKLFVLALVVAFGASPSNAQEAGAGAAGTNDIVVKGQQYERKVVCRQQQNTGTRFATRVCHTNKAWDEMREQHRRNAKEMIDKPIIDISRNS